MRLRFITKRLYPILILPLALASCAYFIPENPNTPRYNQVMGERHPPQENIGSMRAGQQSASAPVEPIYAEPIATAPVTGPDDGYQPPAGLPPVDAQTKAIAQQRMQTAQNESTVIDRINPWSSGAQPGEQRMVPMENQPAVNNGDYPVLNEVPPAPSSSADAARLAKVRQQLEHDRLQSEVTTTKTLRDAQSDPSMLAPMPEPTSSTVPAPDPVSSAPLPPPINMDSYNTAPVNVPPMNQVRSIASLPPPPAPLMAASPVANASAQSASIEPILLRQPAPIMAPEPPAYSLNPPPPSPVAMVPASGSFDPMAGAPPITLKPPTQQASAQAYLPPSRYSYRR
jgi:hypothetical protein